MACYAAAKIAWNWDSDHQELEKAPEGIRGEVGEVEEVGSRGKI